MKRNTAYNSIKIFSESVPGNISGPDSLSLEKQASKYYPIRSALITKMGRIYVQGVR